MHTRTPAAGADLAAVRTEFIQSDTTWERRPLTSGRVSLRLIRRPSLRALAEQHDVPYAAVLRAARVERWDAIRDVAMYRRRVDAKARALADARRTAAEESARLQRALGDPGTDPRSLSELARNAARAFDDVSFSAHHLAELQGCLAAAEAKLAGRRAAAPVRRAA